MSGLLVISEEKLWDLVRDAYEEGKVASGTEQTWNMARSRIQVIQWLDYQKNKASK